MGPCGGSQQVTQAACQGTAPQGGTALRAHQGRRHASQRCVWAPHSPSRCARDRCAQSNPSRWSSPGPHSALVIMIAMSKKPSGPAPASVMHSTLRTPHTSWAFRLWLSPSGRNELSKWDAKLSTQGKARRNTAMKFLRVQPAERWSRPQASPLSDHVYVIRFHDETHSQHRLFGYFDLDHHAFVICFAGNEKDGVYHPADYVQRTIRCRQELSGHFSERTVECSWPIA